MRGAEGDPQARATGRHGRRANRADQKAALSPEEEDALLVNHHQRAEALSVVDDEIAPTQPGYWASRDNRQLNVRVLLRLIAVFVALVLAFSVAFHLLMEAEGQRHSWVTGFYWTLTVMSTLGFGDITFQSDAGRVFSMLVMISGVIFLLVLLPFTFIQFFYAPWMEAQRRMQAPRELPPTERGHVSGCTTPRLCTSPYDSPANSGACESG